MVAKQAHSASTICGVTVGAVTVTFQPDFEKLARQCEALDAQLQWVLVDNGSSASDLAFIEGLIARRGNTRLILNPLNAGLAAAVNQGVAILDSEFVLLLDQDTEPQEGSIKALVEGFLQLECTGKNVACVGPMLLDEDTGGSHGFHQMKKGMWVRAYPGDDDPSPVPCTNLNGSGTLVRASYFRELAGLAEPLFIDHVDTDWSFRVLRQGGLLFGLPRARFVHSMGEEGIRFWLLGWRVWPKRSPARHYYLFRNTVWLLKAGHVPAVWKFWAVIKMMLTATVCGVFDPRRAEHLKRMGKGLWHGVAGRMGREP
ncbi:glycosyltransferase [Pseudomonas nitroreducens]|uniref:glycosyltransferase n=1 Tax=Pseudomonas nitroreducens TaxID=46680 RepID=UPI002449182E|nr:glycosyltransferase [Pseudomonas nitroreducens]MDG9853619.1 glycosyltransferase [Pseudomonas nitroreducens]MDH1076026.1 glycosyltransferase [Pseudomonas nitroreducens]